MFLSSRPTRLRAVIVAASFGLLACGGERITSPSRAGTGPSFAAGGKKAALKPTITNVVLSSSSMTIGGASVSYDVTIQNLGTSDAPGLSIQGEVDQGSVSRAAGGAQVSCAGAAAGVLPPGTCTMTLTAKADNGAQGSGTLMPGNAKLVIMLNQSDGTTTTLLDSRALKVTLVAATPTTVFISALSLAANTFVIGGSAVDYTVTVTNPTGVTQSTVLVQATIKQGTNTAAAYGINVNCVPNSLGVLPPGDCTFTWHTAADPTTSGGNTLVAGPAVWRLELLYYNGTTTTVLDFREINITLTTP